METKNLSGRRDFLKKAAYVAPAVLTLSATPAFAAAGSPVLPGVSAAHAKAAAVAAVVGPIGEPGVPGPNGTPPPFD